jgi:excisionase family DNA binding protein
MSLRGLLRGSHFQNRSVGQKKLSTDFLSKIKPSSVFEAFFRKPLNQHVPGLFYEVLLASTTIKCSKGLQQTRPRLFSFERGKSRTWNKMEQLLLTPKTACEALGISRSTLYRLIADGQIEVTRIRSLPRFTDAALRKFVERQVTQTREQAVGF